MGALTYKEEVKFKQRICAYCENLSTESLLHENNTKNKAYKYKVYYNYCCSKYEFICHIFMKIFSHIFIFYKNIYTIFANLSQKLSIIMNRSVHLQINTCKLSISLNANKNISMNIKIYVFIGKNRCIIHSFFILQFLKLVTLFRKICFCYYEC